MATLANITNDDSDVHLPQEELLSLQQLHDVSGVSREFCFVLFLPFVVWSTWPCYWGNHETQVQNRKAFRMWPFQRGGGSNRRCYWAALWKMLDWGIQNNTLLPFSVSSKSKTSDTLCCVSIWPSSGIQTNLLSSTCCCQVMSPHSSLMRLSRSQVL